MLRMFNQVWNISSGMYFQTFYVKNFQAKLWKRNILVILLGHKFWRTVDYMDASEKIRNDFWVWNGKMFARFSFNGEWLVRWRLSV